MTVPKTLPSLLFLLCVALAAALPANADTSYTKRLTITNNCGDDAWMFIIPPVDDVGFPQSQYWASQNGATTVYTAVCSDDDDTCKQQNTQYKLVISAGESQTFSVPDAGSASFKSYFKLGCTAGTSPFEEFGNCKLGADFPSSQLGSDLAGTHTWFEVTWGCNASDYNTYCSSDPGSAKCLEHCAENPVNNQALGTEDNFDISVVDGYGMPMSVVAEGDGQDQCSNQSGTTGVNSKDLGFLDLASCPAETSTTLEVPSEGDEANIYNWLNEQKSIDLWSTYQYTDGNTYTQNCAHPHSWFSSNVLGTNITDSNRPITPADGTTCTSANWYGCAGSCLDDDGQTVTPSAGAEQCMDGPGDGSKNVAKTKYVRRLKAMGITGYTWQYDDATGDASCPQGLTYTLTLCPLKAGQTPYDTSTQKWTFVSDSNSCTLAGDDATDTYDNYWECISSNAKYSVAKHTGVSYCVPDAGGDYDNYLACANTLDDVPDQQEDIVWRNTTSGKNAVWQMKGETYKSYNLMDDVPLGWNIVGMYDFNEDGYSDIFWHNDSSGANAIWYMRRTERQSWVLIDKTDNAWLPKGIGDFNKNGTPDIVWRNSENGNDYVWYMEDATFKGDAELPQRDLPWELSGVADFDNDNYPDLLWHNPDSGENDIWLMKKTKLKETVSLPTTTTEWELVGTMDINNRGQMDILWRRPDIGKTAIWRMKGTSLASYGFLDSAPSNWEIQGTGVVY